MKEKETFGSLQTQGEYQGRGVQFIYESDGRLESSAEVTGEVCDEEILKKLGTVEALKAWCTASVYPWRWNIAENRSHLYFRCTGKRISTAAERS